MRVERDWLRNLVFNGEEARRFTQDSAILPDVWMSAGLFYCRDPQARVDLLLTPYKDSSPSLLAATVRVRLEGFSNEAVPIAGVRDVYPQPDTKIWADAGAQRRVLLRQTWSLAVNQTGVVVALTLEELIGAVLPLSSWWRKHVGANIGKERMGHDDPDQRRWLERVVGVMLLCARQTSEPEDDLSRRGTAAAFMSLDEAQRLRRASKEDAERFAAIVADVPGQRREFERVLAMAAMPLRPSKKTQEAAIILLWSVGLNRASFVTADRSVHTTKADAARRVFDVNCSSLCWAIVDSGIDAQHPAFRDERGTCRVTRAYHFTRLRALASLDSAPQNGIGSAFRQTNTEDADRRTKRIRESLRRGRFVDWSALLPLISLPLDPQSFQAPINDHGTHVAGILAARRTEAEPTLEGMCPDIKLCDLRVLNAAGRGDEFAVISALQFIRYLNANSDRQVIHGVNISLSLIHDVENYACGRTPVCEECERLVNSGVVVIVAAGNRGYETVLTSGGELEGYRDISITDPGNAEAVVTVGSTHRFEPHTYGVSYFSSRGPTGDGRIKPDVLAPGEKIRSTVPGGGYEPKDGTSMAAPHASGVAALLMARYTEFLGHPNKIKQILLASATDLGREKYFQGAGLVDALRALQSV